MKCYTLNAKWKKSIIHGWEECERWVEESQRQIATLKYSKTARATFVSHGFGYSRIPVGGLLDHYHHANKNNTAHHCIKNKGYLSLLGVLEQANTGKGLFLDQDWDTLNSRHMPVENF